MKLFITTTLALLLAFPVYAQKTSDKTVAEKLQEISVTIRSGGNQSKSEGSGVLFSRIIDGEDTTFVWTAEHVIDNLRTSKEVLDPKTGTKRLKIAYKDVQVLQELIQDGRRVGEIVMDAEVIKVSDSEEGHDLALLMVRKKGYATESAVFYLDEEIPKIGTRLFHVGSLLGQMGSNSMTTGIVSQIGRILNGIPSKVVFDQTTATAFPGSSGGGVYLAEDGRYVGMLVRGAGEGFNFIVPARRLIRWAKEQDLEWAVDPKAKTPTMKEIRKIVIEDVDFSGSPKKLSKKGHFLRQYNIVPVPQKISSVEELYFD